MMSVPVRPSDAVARGESLSIGDLGAKYLAIDSRFMLSLPGSDRCERNSSKFGSQLRWFRGAGRGGAFANVRGCVRLRHGSCVLHHKLVIRQVKSPAAKQHMRLNDRHFLVVPPAEPFDRAHNLTLNLMRSVQVDGITTSSKTSSSGHWILDFAHAASRCFISARRSAL